MVDPILPFVVRYVIPLRRTGERRHGMYLTFDQAVAVAPILQGALFAFPRQPAS